MMMMMMMTMTQYLAEASPPALGISALRQSIEFQKLIGSVNFAYIRGKAHQVFKFCIYCVHCVFCTWLVTLHPKIGWHIPEVL